MAFPALHEWKQTLLKSQGIPGHNRAQNYRRLMLEYKKVTKGLETTEKWLRIMLKKTV